MTLPREYGGVLRKRGELHQYKLDGIDGTEVIEESDAVMKDHRDSEETITPRVWSGQHIAARSWDHE